jgi:hypothetical protein
MSSDVLNALQQRPVSHGTEVERTRAVSEVFAAAQLAMMYPRDVRACEAEMLEACSDLEFAQAAEFALPRSDENIVGPSVQLARQLALIWGHITHGVVEISRDPDRGQSELMAYAWEVTKNARSARTFIVPHIRDRNKGGPATLTKQQDITNQNNSVAARQLRENIFAVLPAGFKARAIARCRQTVAEHEQRAAGELAAFSERVDTALRAWSGNGISAQQLEGWCGVRRRDWTDETLARLQVLWRSLAAGELTVDEAFSDPSTPGPSQPAGASLADLQGQPAEGADLERSLELDLEPSDAERSQYGGDPA